MKMTGPTTGQSRLSSAALAGFVFVAGAAIASPQHHAASEPTTSSASPQEILGLAREATANMQDTLRSDVQLQELAKKQKDVIKLNCVNDKVLQTKGHIAVADQSIASINEAVGKGDNAGVQHEYSRVKILQQKVLVLGTEAQNCIGEDLSYVGATTVTVEINPNIPTQDVTDTGFPVIDTSRLPAASPVM